MAEPALVGVPNFDKLELINTGKASFTFLASDSSYGAITHNLGYIPIALVYWTNEDESLFDPLPVMRGLSLDTINIRVNFNGWLYYALDKTYLYINFANPGSDTPTYNFRYYLFRQSAR